MRHIIIYILLALPIATHGQSSDSILYGRMRECGVTFSHNNAVCLLTNGQEKFDDMFTAIRQARHSVHLEYFNFRNDSIASLLFDILAPFGNSSNNRPLKKSHITELRRRGIEIYEFDPLRFPWINHVFSRDHRKIVVIDGEIGYTGGMNVADYYINGTEVVGSWHDMHCRIEGEAVHTLQSIFLKTWNMVTRQNIHGPEYYRSFRPSGHFQELKQDTTTTTLP